MPSYGFARTRFSLSNGKWITLAIAPEPFTDKHTNEHFVYGFREPQDKQACVAFAVMAVSMKGDTHLQAIRELPMLPRLWKRGRVR